MKRAKTKLIKIFALVLVLNTVFVATVACDRDRDIIYDISFRYIIANNPEWFYAFERMDEDDDTYGLPIDAYYNAKILAALSGLVLARLTYEEDIAAYAYGYHQHLRTKTSDADVKFVFGWDTDLFLFVWSPELGGTFDVSVTGTAHYLERLQEIIYSFQ
ncbi:MAG: hypothetical protein FWC20_09590 [Oscillospiraceae bacterium]|nr:hypothetical protein [Oscillospiraceae bacterium]MCL2279642.1 hypothetical protein [Oscillospiraceae bacterium]